MSVSLHPKGWQLSAATPLGVNLHLLFKVYLQAKRPIVGAHKCLI